MGFSGRLKEKCQKKRVSVTSGSSVSCYCTMVKKPGSPEPGGEICVDGGINEEKTHCTTGAAPALLRSGGDSLSLSSCPLLQGFLLLE